MVRSIGATLPTTALGFALGAGGGGSGDTRAAAAREACYPACIAKLMERCPLVSACIIQGACDFGALAPRSNLSL